jgi:hypothetical protein
MTNLVFKRGLIAIALCGVGIAYADESSSVAQPAPQTPGAGQMAPTGLQDPVVPPQIANVPSAPSNPCRQISTQAQIDGVTQVVQGVACPRPDGRWQIYPDTGDMDSGAIDSGDAETDAVGSYPVYPDYATYPGYYAYDPWLAYSPFVFGFGFGFGGSFFFANHFDHFDRFHGFHHRYYGYAGRPGFQHVGDRGFGNRGFMNHSFGGRGFGGGGFGGRR